MFFFVVCKLKQILAPDSASRLPAELIYCTFFESASRHFMLKSFIIRMEWNEKGKILLNDHFKNYYNHICKTNIIITMNVNYWNIVKYL